MYDDALVFLRIPFMIDWNRYEALRAYVLSDNDKRISHAKNIPPKDSTDYDVTYLASLDKYLYEVSQVDPFALSKIDPNKVINIVIPVETTSPSPHTNKYSINSIITKIEQLTKYYDGIVTLVNTGSHKVYPEILDFVHHNARIKVFDYFAGNVSDFLSDLRKVL